MKAHSQTKYWHFGVILLLSLLHVAVALVELRDSGRAIAAGAGL